MSRQRRRSRRAPQASQIPPPLPHPFAEICRPRPLSDKEWKAFQQRAPGYAGFEAIVSPADQAAAKRWAERLEQYAQEHRRWVEAEIARAAAEETAKRAAVEREARRRRRSRAAKRAAKRKAAERKAASVIAEQQAAAECKAVKQKTPRLPQRSDAQRVVMTQDDIDWARKALQDDIKEGFRSLDAAYSWFKDRWSKDLNRRTRKVPSRTQFS